MKLLFSFLAGFVFAHSQFEESKSGGKGLLTFQCIEITELKLCSPQAWLQIQIPTELRAGLTPSHKISSFQTILLFLYQKQNAPYDDKQFSIEHQSFVLYRLVWIFPFHAQPKKQGFCCSEKYFSPSFHRFMMQNIHNLEKARIHKLSTLAKLYSQDIKKLFVFSLLKKVLLMFLFTLL